LREGGCGNKEQAGKELHEMLDSLWDCSVKNPV
jgi:hypothetical protein